MSDEEPESTLYVKYPNKLVTLLEKVRQEHPHVFAPIEKRYREMSIEKRYREMFGLAREITMEDLLNFAHEYRFSLITGEPLTPAPDMSLADDETI
jgi:hypothetical protein